MNNLSNSNFNLPNGSSTNQLPPLGSIPFSSSPDPPSQPRLPTIHSPLAPPSSTSNPPGVLHLQPQRTVGGGPSTAGTGTTPSPSQNHSLPPPPSNSSTTATHPSLPPPPTAGMTTTTTTTTTVTGGGNQNPQTPAQQVLFSPADRYGLLGLLHIIKESDPDLSMLALGTDLTTLGLDLSATELVWFLFLWCELAGSRTDAGILQEPLFDLHYALVRFESCFGSEYRTRLPSPFVLQRSTSSCRRQDWQL